MKIGEKDKRKQVRRKKKFYFFFDKFSFSVASHRKQPRQEKWKEIERSNKEKTKNRKFFLITKQLSCVHEIYL